MQRLSEKSDLALDYSSLVLFPETFIHKHMVREEEEEDREGEIGQILMLNFSTEPGQD